MERSGRQGSPGLKQNSVGLQDAAQADNTLIVYFFLSYLVNFFICTDFAVLAAPTGPGGWLYVSALMVTYPLIYMLPLGLLVVLGRTAIGRTLSLEKSRAEPIPPGATRAMAILIALVVLLNALLTIVLYSDMRLFELYGFHVNAFVINLLVTPGGIESMGGGKDTYLAAGMLTVLLVALHLGLLFIAYLGRCKRRLGKRTVQVMFAIFVLLAASERVAYGISDSQQYAPVLKAAAVVPLYNHVTFRSLLVKLGFNVTDRHDIRLAESAQQLDYPRQALRLDTTDAPLNIIWIVSESMRWDMLSPEIMPATYNASQTGWRFDRHYSGGNGTRQGLFSLFYGIYGSYWDTFLMEGRSPVLLDLLQARGYQMEMFTSADFTYPEFDRTLFANIPDSNMHQFDSDMAAWKRDEANTDKIIESIRSRDNTKPFMTFMFYESTHARYDFPDDSAIRKPYLAELNYATMTRKSLALRIVELKNRYINASHYIDSQLAKIYALLDEEGLWANTIVMVTGDHGEEFMENGFWGHNSGFSEEQIRTPMVLWIPGAKPKVISSETSHMDIVPTILPLLGVKNPAEDYSLGIDLAQVDQQALEQRPYIVVSDWAGVAYLGDDYKFSLPFNSSLSATNQLFTRSDQSVADIVPFISQHRGQLDEILHKVTLFTSQ